MMMMMKPVLHCNKGNALFLESHCPGLVLGMGCFDLLQMQMQMQMQPVRKSSVHDHQRIKLSGSLRRGEERILGLAWPGLLLAACLLAGTVD